MKKLNKLFGLMLIAGCSMSLASNVNAAANYTAQGATQKYTSLADCLAEDEDTCTLLAADTLSTAVSVKKNVVIDLNGKTLTMNTSGTITVTPEANANDRVNVTVKNGTVDATNGGKAFVVDGKADLTLDSVTVKGNSTNTVVARVINDGGTLTIKNSELSGDAPVMLGNSYDNGATKNASVTITDTKITAKYQAITVNGRVNDTNNSIVLSGNTFTATDGAAIYAAGYANWTIESGTYKGLDAVGIRSGKFNIKGGTFEATGSLVQLDTLVNGDGGQTLTGAAVTVASKPANSQYKGEVELTIDGGTFKAAEGPAVYEFIKDNQPTSLKALAINDGTFNAGTATRNTIVVYNPDVKNFMNGGSYTKGNEGFVYAASSEPYGKGLTLEEGSDHIAVVGKKYTLSVIKEFTTLTGIKYNVIDEIAAVEGEKINLVSLLGIGSQVPDSRTHRYAVQYVLSNGTTGLDEFTMPSGENITIELEIVEVPNTTEPSEVIPSTPGTDPTPGEPTNPDEPGREPEAGEKDPSEELPENQPTGDNVMGSVAMGIAGLVGIVGSALVFDKKTNYNN